jgi:hypothetical protein
VCPIELMLRQAIGAIQVGIGQIHPHHRYIYD